MLFVAAVVLRCAGLDGVASTAGDDGQRSRGTTGSTRNCNQPTSIGLRLEFWEKSLRFFAEAPVDRPRHRIDAGAVRGGGDRACGAGARRQVIGNPHNQTLNVAVQWGIARGRDAVRDVAFAFRAVSRRGPGGLDRADGGACRTSSLRCSTRICSIFMRAGCMCWASASPAAWCCAPGREAAESSGTVRAMIAGMRAADKISADAGCASRIPIAFRSRPLE